MIQRLLVNGILILALAVGHLNAAELPSEAGQSAFAALAEISAALSADETTDWSRVNLLALREHLVDMNEVMLNARVEERQIDGGVQVRVSGTGRTLEALQRMIPMHSHMMGSGAGRQVAVRELPDGFEIDLTTDDPAGVARLRGLGFFGFLADGNHHRRHHLGLASGAMAHGHH